MTYQRIRRYLREHRITQAELAQRMGISAATVNSVLSGKHRMGVMMYFRICAALGESPLRFAPPAEPERMV